MKKKKDRKTVVVYQAKSGAIELRGDFAHDTVWATQSNLIALFGVHRSVISRHIKNIFKDKEIDPKSNLQKMQIANSDKPTLLYSLDVILAVGYRTNSKVAIEFRKWATKVLKGHIVQGYTINRRSISQNYDEFMKAVENIQSLLPEHITFDPNAVLDLVKEFAGTWMSLDAYDKESLKVNNATKKSVAFTAGELLSEIQVLKGELLVQEGATDIFATERRTGSVEGIVGNIMQSFGGKPMYPSVEEKAAHLLYFMVKNHPFVDGNKRAAAFSFVWFLRKTRLGKFRLVNPATLTALTLLIAESNPNKKDQMVALVTQLLG